MISFRGGPGPSAYFAATGQIVEGHDKILYIWSIESDWITIALAQ